MWGATGPLHSNSAGHNLYFHPVIIRPTASDINMHTPTFTQTARGQVQQITQQQEHKMNIWNLST